jgi:hypothetical protein
MPSHLKLTPIVLLVLISCCLSVALAQSDRPAPPRQSPTSDQKVQEILQRAIESVGGNDYLQVRSLLGKGLFTQFKDGVSGTPAHFTDYIVYPDRERTEFRGGGTRVIQTNTGDTGWVFDAAARTIVDMKASQIEDFRFAIRTGMENLLRGWWQKDHATLSYVGRREAGLARRNEVLRLSYPDGFAIEFEFGARDGLPAKILYKKKNSEGEEVSEEDRLLKPIKINGITTFFVVDHFRAGVQTSRLNYETMEYNASIPDSVFARPTNPKAVK